MCCYSDIMVVRHATMLSFVFPDMKLYNVVVFLKIYSSFKQLPHHNSLTIEMTAGTTLALKTHYCRYKFNTQVSWYKYAVKAKRNKGIKNAGHDLNPGCCYWSHVSDSLTEPSGPAANQQAHIPISLCHEPKFSQDCHQAIPFHPGTV